MGWVPAVMAGLLLTAIGVRIWGQHLPAEYDDLYPQQQDPQEDGCFPALFSFGSSVADTGTESIALPFVKTEALPYGSTFFGKPSKRYSDGRLHIDFWALALNLPFLDPYLKSVGSNFRRGANFAAAGSTAANDTRRSPFSLSVQLNQFREFKTDVLARIGHGGQRFSKLSTESDHDRNKLPLEKYFRNALYVIAIGGNDIMKLFIDQEYSVQKVELHVPEVSRIILGVVEALYAEGARNILVEDVFPLGCISAVLEHYAVNNSDPLDDAGCSKSVNAMVQLHNSLLKQGVIELGARLGPDAAIAVVETYRKRYDIIANYAQYGLKVPLKPCYRELGKSNSNFRSDCGSGQSIMVDEQMLTSCLCDNVSSHAMWDRFHFTDAFNQITMRDILSGKYFAPGFAIIRNSCTLAQI